MTQTMKQTQRHREQTCGCQEGRGGEGMEWQFRCKLLYIDRMDKWQGSTVYHRELYSTSCDNP